MQINEILKSYFGYASLPPQPGSDYQRGNAGTRLSGSHADWWWKESCYQVPALAMEGHRCGHFTAHQSDARPGGGAQGKRYPG